MKKIGLVSIALLAALVGITGSVSAASASIKKPEFSNVEKLSKIKQHEVEGLLDELVLVRLQQSQAVSTDSITELRAKDKAIVGELKEKGVRPLSKEEIEVLNKSTAAAQNTGFQTLASSPPTWGPYANVDMLTLGEKTVTVDGKTYKEWINYAVPKTGGGAPLVKHYASVKLMNEPFETAKFVNKVFNLLLQRAIGTVKFSSWTPYDYFWPEGQSYTSFNTYDLLVSYASKMKYVWVYIPSTDIWQLKASANSVQTTENHIARGYKNGSLTNIPKLKYNTVWSDDYDDIETIAPTSAFHFTSPVNTMSYTKIDGGTALSFFPYYASGPADLY